MQQRGVGFVCIYECEFDELARHEPDIRQMMAAFYPPFYKSHKGRVTQPQILRAVQKNQFFGLLLVDLFLPHELRDKFSEYPALYANHDVKYSDIGPYMQKYVDENDLKFKSRRMLISAHEGRNLLLNSELLSWYLNNGFVCTKITQCVESVPARPFIEFAEQVETKRRLADNCPGEKVRSNLAKLIG